MFLVVQSSSNTIYPSLSERVTLTGSVKYLFRFINDESKQETSCIGVETSTDYTYRYTKLTITEADNASEANRQAGTVTLQPEGWWTYEIYEQLSTTNLDYTSATSRLEVGKMKVLPATESVTTEYTGATVSNQVYSG